ncbi:MAG: translational GTPase TypA [SAR324 cluster bacterium]|nr:translational GTPase TypA [SAR324 cluster bacterium]
MKRSDLRNLAIIAHVDHGKTTLLDKLLEQSGMLSGHKEREECIMDSNPLERERGITILAKSTALHYEGVRINIVDTPGHADFGGEVERILNMVDGVLLLVDAAEGPMPQTKFVLRKALELGLKPIVVINKIDRQGADPENALNKVFDLFIELEASEEQLEFSYVYASAKAGFAMEDLAAPHEDLKPLLDLILKQIPIAEVELEKPFQMLISNIHYDNYLGRLLLGRIHQGQLRSNQRIARIDGLGQTHFGQLSKIFFFEGLEREEVPEAKAGDIVMVAGFPNGMVGETLACSENPAALPSIEVDAPTISMNFCVNNSPFAGNDGKYVTSRHIRARLERELLSNISLKVEDTDSMDEFKVSGRGELHLSILIETMRRDGYEFGVSRPHVIIKEVDGKKKEPIEELVMELPEEAMGPVMEELGRRKGEVQHLEHFAGNNVRLNVHIPTRGLIGFRSLCMTLTKGECIMNHTLIGYEPYRGETSSRSHGVLLAKEQGEAIPYAIWKLQDRGYFIIPPNVPVYEGMIVGANSRENDLITNVCAKKQLTNIRASGRDEAVRVIPHKELSLEQALEFIADDELVEVTPKTFRLRKRILNENQRKMEEKKRKVLN